MLKLKDLIATMDKETVICVCDDFGPITDVKPLSEISVKTLMHDLDRNVEKIYFDPSDNSITIELEERNFDDEN